MPIAANKEKTPRKQTSTLRPTIVGPHSCLRARRFHPAWRPTPHERPAARIDPQGPRKRVARRQVQPGIRPRLHERRAGAGAPADAAAPARCARRPEHRRFRQRLSRQPARRLRPVAVGGEEAPGRQPHRLPAGRERGTRRHRGVGHAAARPVPVGEEIRRRVRHLVRQGPRRRPLQRRVQARQHGRHGTARRRDRHRRRRPCRQEQHRRAPERPHLQGLRAAGVLSRATCRTSSTWGCMPSRWAASRACGWA